MLKLPCNSSRTLTNDLKHWDDLNNHFLLPFQEKLMIMYYDINILYNIWYHISYHIYILYHAPC